MQATGCGAQVAKVAYDYFAKGATADNATATADPTINLAKGATGEMVEAVRERSTRA